MPLDPSFSAPVAFNETVKSKDLTQRFDLLEDFVNGGVEVSDIKYSTAAETKSSGVTFSSDPRQDAFESRHILKPEYYVSANPRIEGVSSDTFYRNVPDGKMNRHVRHETSGQVLSDYLSRTDVNALPPSAWQPIDGMSASIFVKGDSQVVAFVCGSMYAWASGATDFYGLTVAEQAQNYGRGPDEGKDHSESQWSAWYRGRAGRTTIGVFKLFVHRPGEDIDDYKSTERWLYGRGERSYRSKRSQMSFATSITLQPGMNKVSYRCVYRLPSLTSRMQQHLYIDARNFFVDVHYK